MQHRHGIPNRRPKQHRVKTSKLNAQLCTAFRSMHAVASGRIFNEFSSEQTEQQIVQVSSLKFFSIRSGICAVFLSSQLSIYAIILCFCVLLLLLLALAGPMVGWPAGRKCYRQRTDRPLTQIFICQTPMQTSVGCLFWFFLPFPSYLPRFSNILPKPNAAAEHFFFLHSNKKCETLRRNEFAN